MLFHPLRSPFPEHPPYPYDASNPTLGTPPQRPTRQAKPTTQKKAEPPFTDGSASIFILPKQIGKSF